MNEMWGFVVLPSTYVIATPAAQSIAAKPKQVRPGQSFESCPALTMSFEKVKILVVLTLGFVWFL